MEKDLAFEYVEIEKLKKHPENFKEHPAKQKKLLRSIVNEVGWASPILVNKRTMRVLDGHLRLEEAYFRGMDKVPVYFVDVDEDTERKILYLFDTVAKLSKTNKDKQRELLQKLIIKDPELIRQIEEWKHALQEAEEGEFKLSPDMLLEYNYLILVFREPINWEWAKNEFGITYRKEKFSGKKGICFTVDGDEYVGKRKV